MLTKERLLRDVLNTMTSYSDCLYEAPDQENVKSLAYMSGYCDMVSRVLELMNEEGE